MATTELRSRDVGHENEDTSIGEQAEDVVDGMVAEQNGENGKVDDDVYEPIRIKNMDEVNQSELVKKMQERFKEKSDMWNRRANIYYRWSLVMNIAVLVIQFVQIVLHDVNPDWISPGYVTMLQKILIGMTTMIVTLHMKLKIKENAEKYRNGAKVYDELLRKTDYYVMIIESGGKVDGVADWLQTAIEKEDQFTFLLSHLSMKLE